MFNPGSAESTPRPGSAMTTSSSSGLKPDSDLGQRVKKIGRKRLAARAKPKLRDHIVFYIFVYFCIILHFLYSLYSFIHFSHFRTVRLYTSVQFVRFCTVCSNEYSSV